MEDEKHSFLPKQRAISGYFPDDGPELKTLNSYMKWVCLDQTNIWRTGCSWSIFFIFTIAIPLISHFALACSSCDENHSRPFHVEVQISLSVFATVSFVSLSRWSRKYGLRRFLFLDKLSDSSQKIQFGYAHQLQRSMKLLLILVLSCCFAESAYKIWWYASGATKVPYYGNIYVSYIIACTLELSSWTYRTSIFFFICLLYRLVCYLQILRLEDFAKVFQQEAKVETILIEHLKIRRILRIISHRFRLVILSFLLFVTASQLCSLVMTTRSKAKVNIFKAGQLALCSITLLTGLLICLRSAAKVTHKAQSITGLAAKWHICATINSFDDHDNVAPTPEIASAQVSPVRADWGSEEEEERDVDDDLDDAKMMPIYSHTMSFQKRQSLVTYLENNKAGITVFGFMVDRGWLHSIFAIELALMLWMLNKTIGIS